MTAESSNLLMYLGLPSFYKIQNISVNKRSFESFLNKQTEIIECKTTKSRIVDS